jgi:hypothetical protein
MLGVAIISFASLFLLFGFLQSWIGASGFAIGAALLLTFGMRWGTMLLARLNPHLPGPHTLWISPAGFGGQSAGVGEMSLQWGMLEGVYDSPRYIIMQYRSGPATVVPKSAFATPEAAARFLADGQDWFAKSRV